MAENETTKLPSVEDFLSRERKPKQSLPSVDEFMTSEARPAQQAAAETEMNAVLSPNQAGLPQPVISAGPKLDIGPRPASAAERLFREQREQKGAPLVPSKRSIAVGVDVPTHKPVPDQTTLSAGSKMPTIAPKEDYGQTTATVKGAAAAGMSREPEPSAIDQMGDEGRAQLLTTLRGRAKQRIEEINKSRPGIKLLSMLPPGFLGGDPTGANPEDVITEEAYKLYREIDSADPSKTGLFQGLSRLGKVNPTAEMPFLSGIMDVRRQGLAYFIADKERRKQPLTPAEELYLDAYTSALATADAFRPGIADEIGSGAAASLKYIGEFGLTAGAGEGVSAPIDAAVQKGARNIFGRRMEKWVAREAMKSTAENVTRGAGREALYRGTQQLLKVPGMAAAGATQAALNPQNIAADTLRRMTPQADVRTVNGTDQIVRTLDTKGGDAPLVALLKSAGVQVAEFGSERAGSMIEEPLTILKSRLLDAWVAKKGFRSIEQALEYSKNIPGWNGIIAETGEEFLAQILQNPIEGRPLSTGFSPEDIVKTVGTVGLVGAMGGAVGAGVETGKGIKRAVTADANLRERAGNAIEVPPSNAPSASPYEIGQQIAPEVADAAATLGRSQQVEETARRIAAGLPAVPTSPVIPETAPDAPQVRVLTPDMISATAGAIRALPEEQRGEGLLQLHQEVSEWLANQSRVIGPDGKIAYAKTPDQATKIAAGWINDEIDRQDKEAAAQAEATPAPLPVTPEAVTLGKARKARRAKTAKVTESPQDASLVPAAGETPSETAAASPAPEAQALDTKESSTTPAVQGSAPAPLKKGDQVRLPDGQVGTIAFTHSQMKIARVDVGGKKISLPLSKLARVETEEPADVRARRAAQPRPTAMQFVSPNVHELPDVNSAKIRLVSKSHQEALKAYDEIDRGLGLPSGHKSGIGVWKTGAENTVINRVSGQVDPDALRYSTALKGKISHQISALQFQQAEGGKDLLHEFMVPLKEANAAELKHRLEVAGLEYHTLDPVTGGHKVIILDQNGEQADKVEEAARRFRVRNVETSQGSGEFIGGDDRVGAQSAYDDVLREVEQRHPEWRDVREKAESSRATNLIREATKAKTPFVTARHGSPRMDLETLKPEKNFSNERVAKGAEHKRAAAYPKQFQNRVYLQKEGTRREPMYENLPGQYRAILNRENLYDYNPDTDEGGYYEKARVQAEKDGDTSLSYVATLWERELKRAGYDGYMDPNGVIASFSNVKVTPQFIDAWKQYFTAEELEKIKTPEQQVKFIQNIGKLPGLDEAIEAAKLGISGMRWYQRGMRMYNALNYAAPEIFRLEDKQTFMDLLAALSPQQGVPENLVQLFQVWRRWLDAGRPRDIKSINKVVRIQDVDLEARRQNSVRALLGENISGLKVFDFTGALKGDLERTVIDRIINHFIGQEMNLGRPENYFAIGLLLRQAARELGWDPSEAQAAIWVATEAIREKVGVRTGGRVRLSPEEVAESITPEAVAESPAAKDPLDLIRDSVKIRVALEKLGVALERLDEGISREDLEEPKPTGSGELRREVLTKTARRVAESGKDDIERGDSSEGDAEEDDSFDPEDLKALREVSGEPIPAIKQREVEPAPVFYSKMMRVAEEKLPNTITKQEAKTIPQQAIPERVVNGRTIPARIIPAKTAAERSVADQVLETLRNNGVKEDEIKWSGLDDFLKGKDKVSKEEVLGVLESNRIELRDVVHGDIPERERAEIRKMEHELQNFTYNNIGQARMALELELQKAAGITAEDLQEHARLKNEMHDVYRMLSDSVTLDEFGGHDNSKAAIKEVLDAVAVGGKDQANEYSPRTWELAEQYFDLQGKTNSTMSKLQAVKNVAKAASESGASIKEVKELIRDFHLYSWNPEAMDPQVLASAEQKFQQRAKMANALEAKKESYQPSKTKYAEHQAVKGGKNYQEKLVQWSPAIPHANVDPAAAKFIDRHWTVVSKVPVEQLPQTFRALQGQNANLSAHQLMLAYENEKARENSPYRGKNFKGGHWDEANVIAHIRTSEHETPDGDAVYLNQEFQSDWNLKGRDKGFTDKPLEPITITKIESGAGVFNVEFSDGSRSYVGKGTLGHTASDEEIKEYYKNILKEKNDAAATEYNKRVPDFPFKKNWLEVAVKRSLRFAVEQSAEREAAGEKPFKYFAWVTGKQTADLYQLSKHVDRIGYTKRKDGTYNLNGSKNGVTVFEKFYLPADDLANYIGKELARKIIEQTPGVYDRHEGDITGELKGLDLEMGGEWAKNLYDREVSSFLQSYAKKWNAKVQDISVQGGRKWQEVKPNTYREIVKVETGEVVATVPADQADAIRDGWSQRWPDNSFISRPTLMAEVPESITVHAIEITPEMRRSVVEEGQPLFRKDGATASTIPAQLAQSVLQKKQKIDLNGWTHQQIVDKFGEDFANRIRAAKVGFARGIENAWIDYEPRQGDLPGIIRTDMAGKMLFELAQGDKDWVAITISPGKHVDKLIDRLTNLAKDHEDINPRAAQKFRQALYTVRQAAKENPGGVAITPQLGMISESAESEERGHVIQGELGQGFIAKHASAELANEPEFQAAATHLERIGYDTSKPWLVVVEASMHAMVGDNMGLSREQRARLIKKYLDDIVKRYGMEGVKRLQQVARADAEQVFADFIKEKEPVNARETAVPTGTQSSTRPPGRADQVVPRDAGRPARESDRGQAPPVRGATQEQLALFSKDVTKTPQFKAWFGESKVVDEDGQPVVLYHGTSGRFTAFRTPLSWFTTDEADARDYEPKRVIAAYLSIKNPADLDDPRVRSVLRKGGVKYDDDLFTLTTEDGEKTRDVLSRAGYDGLVVQRDDIDYGVAHYAAFYPSQIKSAIGNVDFNPDEPSFLKALRPKQQELIRKDQILADLSKKLGDIPIRVGRFTQQAHGIYKVFPEAIRMRKALDLGTAAHEIGHHINKLLWGATQQKGLNWAPLTPYTQELEAIATKPRSGQSKLPEGFAEYVRMYLTEPQQAIAKAPTFHAFFEGELSREPDLKLALETAQQEIQRYLQQTPEAGVLAQISMEDNPVPSNTFEKAYTFAVDRLTPIKSVEKAMANQAGTNPTFAGYDAARLLAGWWGKADTFLKKETFDPSSYQATGKGLKEILDPVRGRLNDLRIYVVSKRAVEKDAQGIDTGVRMDWARKNVAKFEQDKAIVDAAQGLWEFNDQLLQYSLKHGMMTQEQYDAIRKMNEFYVPFFRVFEEKPGAPAGSAGGKRIGNMWNPVKRMKGSGRPILDPIESIVKNTYTVINLADRNRVMQILVAEANKSEGSARWIEKVPGPMKPTQVEIEDMKKQLEAAGIDLTGVDLETVVTVFSPSNMVPKGEGIVSVLVDGKREFYQLHPDLYRAVMSLDEESINFIIKMLAKPASMLRLGATSLSPAFVVRNPIRDTWDAFLQSKNGFIPIWDNMIGLFHFAKRTDLYWKWKKAGGEHAAMVAMDRNTIRENLDDLMANKVGFTVRHPIEALRIVSEATEAMTRLGEFSRAIKKGRTAEQAALDSRDVTLDFSRMGAKTKALNMIIAFWNASVQGTDKFIRTHRERPLRSMLMGMSSLTLPTLLLYMLNKDDEEYWEQPQYIRDFFFLIPTDGTPLEDATPFIRIPKPFLWGMIYSTVPERIMQYIDSEDPEAFKGLMQSVADSSTPGAVPTAAIPLLEAWANKSMFTGQRLESQSLQKLPPQFRYKPQTSEFSKMSARGLAELGIEVSPIVLDNSLFGYTGGGGRSLVQAFDKGYRAFNPDGNEKPTPTLADSPLLGGFVTRRNSSSSQSIEDFDERYRELGMKKEAVKVDRKRDGELGAERMTPEEKSEYRKMDAANKLMSMWRQQIRDTMNDRDLNADEKRQRIDELNQKILRKARKTLGRSTSSDES
jgi:hypothetical protein